jgi:hypothetical protein
MDAAPWRSNLLRSVILGVAILSASCQPVSQSVPARDEAARASRSVESLPVADEDYFKAMDGALPLTSDEVKGRNTWIVWTGGNDRFWDSVTNYTFGSFDLLKILSSYPDLKFSRDSRWTISAWSMSHASTRRQDLIPTGMAYGWIAGETTAHRILLTTPRNTRAWHSAPVVEPFPSAPSTARRAASWGFGFFQIRHSTKRRRGDGTRFATTPIRLTTTRRIWCGHIASACHAVSVISARTRICHQPMLNIRGSRT